MFRCEFYHREDVIFAAIIEVCAALICFLQLAARKSPLVVALRWRSARSKMAVFATRALFVVARLHKPREQIFWLKKAIAGRKHCPIFASHHKPHLLHRRRFSSARRRVSSRRAIAFGCLRSFLEESDCINPIRSTHFLVPRSSLFARRRFAFKSATIGVGESSPIAAASPPLVDVNFSSCS